jgi:mono/diheme cytochrome c family protein
MKHLLLGVVGASIALAAAAGARADELGKSQAGFVYAKQFCSKCHGISGEKSPLPQAPRFKKVAEQSGITATALTVWLQTSHPTMPNIILQPQDMRNVIAYILSLKGRE